MTERVLAVIKETFPEAEWANAISYLELYEDKEKERVQLDILKLCKGRMQELARLVGEANKDYRDILYWAEYYNSKE